MAPFSPLLLPESFGMSKIHKDLAMRMMECLQDEEMSDQATVKVHSPPHLQLQ